MVAVMFLYQITVFYNKTQQHHFWNFILMTQCKLCMRASAAAVAVNNKLTNRPGFSGTVPVWDTLSRNPERCLRDAKMSRFGFRSHRRDRMLSK